ncbi:MAG: response regulator [Nitrospiraceae bacterium]
MAQTKILIVDDDATVRLVLSARLKAKNYETIFAGDSYQAVSAARREQPNLVILDLGLPGGDGFIVMERLKAIVALACVPVIIVSAEDPQHAEARAIEAGAKAFLQKPVNAEQLVATIEKTLRESGEPTPKPA